MGLINVRDKEPYSFGGPGKDILIGYPQGALNETIELNESKTVDNATVVLQKIEFTPSEVRFHLLTDIPVAKTAPLPFPTPPDALSSYSASLKVDGEERPVKARAFKADGRWTIVFIADPIQSDAKMLNFVVRNSETWEFSVILK